MIARLVTRILVSTWAGPRFATKSHAIQSPSVLYN